MNRTVLVAIGGLVGSVLRYQLAGWAQSLNRSEFPVGTLTVNVLGIFVIGVLMTLSLERELISADIRILLATGFCGGFTTMSTFGYETVALLREGSSVAGVGNIAVTLGACLTSMWVGGATGRLF